MNDPLATYSFNDVLDIVIYKAEKGKLPNNVSELQYEGLLKAYGIKKIEVKKFINPSLN